MLVRFNIWLVNPRPYFLYFSHSPALVTWNEERIHHHLRSHEMLEILKVLETWMAWIGVFFQKSSRYLQYICRALVLGVGSDIWYLWECLYMFGVFWNGEGSRAYECAFWGLRVESKDGVREGWKENDRILIFVVILIYAQYPPKRKIFTFTKSYLCCFVFLK